MSRNRKEERRQQERRRDVRTKQLEENRLKAMNAYAQKLKTSETSEMPETSETSETSEMPEELKELELEDNQTISTLKEETMNTTTNNQQEQQEQKEINPENLVLELTPEQLSTLAEVLRELYLLDRDNLEAVQTDADVARYCLNQNDPDVKNSIISKVNSVPTSQVKLDVMNELTRLGMVNLTLLGELSAVEIKSTEDMARFSLKKEFTAEDFVKTMRIYTIKLRKNYLDFCDTHDIEKDPAIVEEDASRPAQEALAYLRGLRQDGYIDCIGMDDPQLRRYGRLLEGDYEYFFSYGGTMYDTVKKDATHIKARSKDFLKQVGAAVTALACAGVSIVLLLSDIIMAIANSIIAFFKATYNIIVDKKEILVSIGFTEEDAEAAH